MTRMKIETISKFGGFRDLDWVSEYKEVPKYLISPSGGSVISTSFLYGV